jgi:hypothetical protein
LVDRHSGSVNADWKLRSDRAKKQWKKRQRKLRLSSERGAWLYGISQKLHVQDTKKSCGSDWEKAINVRINSCRGRDVVRKKTYKISGSPSLALARLEARRMWFEKPEWPKKIGNKLSSMKSRRRRKNNVKSKQGRTAFEKAGGKRIQMCFDWMDFNSKGF